MATPDPATWQQWTKYSMNGTTTATASTATWTQWTTDPGTTSATTAAWYRWTSGTAVTTTEPVWTCWVETTTGQRVPIPAPVYQVQSYQPVPTPEQLAERQRWAEERRVEQEAEAAKRKAASEKAEETLTRCLTPEQRKAWKEERAIFVTSQSGRRFKLKAGMTHNVKELDLDGKEIRELCVHVHWSSGCPMADNVLAQLLALRFDEAAFIKRANIWDLTRKDRPIIQRSS